MARTNKTRQPRIGSRKSTRNRKPSLRGLESLQMQLADQERSQRARALRVRRRAENDRNEPAISIEEDDSWSPLIMSVITENDETLKSFCKKLLDEFPENIDDVPIELGSAEAPIYIDDD